MKVNNGFASVNAIVYLNETPPLLLDLSQKWWFIVNKNREKETAAKKLHFWNCMSEEKLSIDSTIFEMRMSFKITKPQINVGWPTESTRRKELEYWFCCDSCLVGGVMVRAESAIKNNRHLWVAEAAFKSQLSHLRDLGQSACLSLRTDLSQRAPHCCAEGRHRLSCQKFPWSVHCTPMHAMEAQWPAFVKRSSLGQSCYLLYVSKGKGLEKLVKEYVSYPLLHLCSEISLPNLLFLTKNSHWGHIMFICLFFVVSTRYRNAL